ncbi:AIPR family protein [Burkholderia contaminans]|uniref:AIPR family protein n=1 Tax=Burkholderia contaminans TaxID=488447 RepID=UPI000F015449|nr:AIPR family protein [Burkholderia contaminans]
MAKNDNVLLDGIVDDRVSLKVPSSERDEVFEYLCIEEVLKNWDLSQDELKSGWIDGRGDGGIDAFHIFVNGHLLQDPDGFVWPKTSAELFVSLITCKHHDTFKLATLDAAASTLVEIFDFSIKNENLKGAYNQDLLRKRSMFHHAYQRLAPSLTKMRVEMVYASRGDKSGLGVEVSSRADHIEKIICDSFRKCESKFSFMGSEELLDSYRRRPNYSLDLEFIQELSRGETYVLLAELKGYFRFIADEEGNLRRYLFESNVRDFVGLNRVNEDIKATLENVNSPDFWWLNNGVTILATGASVVANSIRMQGIQIVNGLQTTESVYRHFSVNRDLDDSRAILVKVIVSNEDSIRDSIIRATNNQTDVEQMSLHATDRIQRNIEEVLYRHGIYYDRRKNFYANQGYSAVDIVSPLYLAAGYVALCLKAPHVAANLKQRNLRVEGNYNQIFSENAPLEVYPRIVKVLKKVDGFLEANRPVRGASTDRFLKGNRHALAIMALAWHFRTFNYSINKLSALDVGLITDDILAEIWMSRGDSATKSGVSWGGRSENERFFRHCADKFGISDVQRVLYSVSPFDAKKRAKSPVPSKVNDEFVLQVKKLLPPQPWKVGMHNSICQALKCGHKDFSQAVDILVSRGDVWRQKDGVLYDLEGNIVKYDAERVDPTTLKLKEF